MKTPPPEGFGLEVDVSSKLELSLRVLPNLANGAEAIRVDSGRPQCLRAGDVHAVFDVCVRVVELRMIEHVVSLEPELRLHALGDGEVLEQAYVRAVIARPVEVVARHVARTHRDVRSVQRRRSKHA